MTAIRVLLGALGLAALGWGGYLAWPLVRSFDLTGLAFVGWVVAGPILHDLLLAPLVAGLAMLLARRLGPGWRGPVVVGGVLTGVLALISVPYFWRVYAGADFPGLHDRNYALGLLIWLVIVWAAVVIAGTLRNRRTARAPRSRETAGTGP